MSLEKKYEEIKRQFGFNPETLIGRNICGYVIDHYVGHGNMGVVFHAKKDVGFEAACKIMPTKRLMIGWQVELEKLGKLEGVPQVVQYKDHDAVIIDNVPTVCILYEFVHGKNLNRYLQECEYVTIEFVELLISEVLNVLQALKTQGLQHGDLHAGNIMVTDPDPRVIDKRRKIKVADFGIGTSDVNKKAKDDYQSFASLCSNILRKRIDPANLDGENRYVRDRLLNDFLEKQLAEKDVTVGDFVMNPEKLLENLNSLRLQFKKLESKGSRSKLTNPFDYLSCEHFGDSWELLQKLYSKNFPGYQELNRRINTILTGPRGCGKTTIFRNLSLKIQLLTQDRNFPDKYIGIYYHCSDLSFAFPYTIEELSQSVQRTITHYFNLAILREILDTLIVAEDHGLKIDENVLEKIRLFLGNWFNACENPPQGTLILRYLLSVVVAAKDAFRENMDINGLCTEKWSIDFNLGKLMPQDFLLRLCILLRDNIPWLNNIPFYIFLDDYSHPKVSREVQFTLHNFILNRYSELFFKISTNSVVTFFPQDAKGQWCEAGREFEIIDLGDYFLHASDEVKQDFLGEIVNNRLDNVQEFDVETRSIQALLGSSPYKTQVGLAEAIKITGSKVHYAGWETVVGLCSGDVANILRLIRNIFSIARLKRKMDVPIKPEIQDKAIRETANEFYAKFKAIPDTGPRIAEIVQAFGDVAHYYLKNRRSKNLKSNPPYQAFRLELLQVPKLSEAQRTKLLPSPVDDNYLSIVFEDLIKYGAFFRDIKGKSQRGAVVPRLYLRRLLIPTFLLTTSKRDHIRVNAAEFRMLLESPEKFKTHMIAKPYKEKEEKDKRQRRLF